MAVPATIICWPHFVKAVLEPRYAKRYAPHEFGEDHTLMRVGYARVSTSDQNPELQLYALWRAGCERVFTEKASGARDDRPELARILEDVLRAGDTLVVWKLDRLARSLQDRKGVV